MALRIKSRWFRESAGKTPQQTASAMAFIVWRVAQDMLKRMRAAGFDVEVGPQYFAFTREVLVFLAHLLDRMAFERMGVEARAEFVTALVRRVGQVLQDNEDALLGELAANEASHFEQFIDLFNEVAGHYAEFGFDAQGPDFACVRYLGHRLEATMPPKDQRWVIEQIMAAEVPDAVQILQRAMEDVLSTEPRAPRSGRTAVSGD